MKKYFKNFVLTDPGSLSMTERLGIIFIPSVIITCMLLYLFIDSQEFFILLILVGFYMIMIGLAYPLIYFEKFDEKYGYYSKLRLGNTYQFTSKITSYLIPGLVIIIFAIGLILENITKASLIAFSFLIPFLALFLRIDVFNDDSSIECGEVILGYPPYYYGLLSLILGIYGYINVNNLLHSYFNLAIVLFIITFIFQILFLIPDKLNKVLFFEIRKKEGFLIYVCLLILCYALFCFIVIGNASFNTVTFDLSFNGIMRKLITWGTAIILALLFRKQIKMNN